MFEPGERQSPAICCFAKKKAFPPLKYLNLVIHCFVFVISSPCIPLALFHIEKSTIINAQMQQA